MKKRDLLLLYLLALFVMSFTIIFQQDPGYMDSEFYYLGGVQILNGKITIPVIWNYLDNPSSLPNPIFSYWMPLPSLLSALSMLIFGASFQGSRILLVLLAAGLAPFAYWLSYKITANHFSSLISGLLAIFSGYYLKFLTIPETVLPYMFLGALYFYIFGYLMSKQKEDAIKKREIVILGIITGFLHLSRADGILFLLLGLGLIIYIWLRKQQIEKTKFTWSLLIFISSYFLIMSFWFVTNSHFYQSIFSPASSKAIWIATYDDTFIYPASELNLHYWLNKSIALRPAQIFEAFKMNLSTFLIVQMMIIGLPLFVLGAIKNKSDFRLRVVTIYFVLIFILMTMIFPLAGSRGGFLHSSSAVQIFIWIMIADGFQEFFKWGIDHRNWQLDRSKKMFGSAFIILIMLFTIVVYKNDVIGNSLSDLKWRQDYKQYEKIEEVILQSTQDKKDVIMINNPLGYYYSTGRWGVVVPNSEADQLLEVIKKFNVKYIVLDKNLPERFNIDQLSIINLYFEKIQTLPSGIEIYAYKS